MLEEGTSDEDLGTGISGRVWRCEATGVLQSAAHQHRHYTLPGTGCVLKAAKVTYIHIPISDLRLMSAQKFEDIMFAMAVGVRRGNLLVHCFAGMSRSPILIAAWLHRCGYAGIDKTG